jgi:hypothetical protein
MSLIPMNLRQPYPTTRQPNLRNSFYLAPSGSTILPAQTSPVTNPIPVAIVSTSVISLTSSKSIVRILQEIQESRITLRLSCELIQLSIKASHCESASSACSAAPQMKLVTGTNITKDGIRDGLYIVRRLREIDAPT